MQKRKLLPLVAVAFLWCNAFACAQYHNLVVAEHDFKAAVQAFQNAESNEFVAGNIDAATHTKMEQGVLLVASGGQQLNMLLQQNASKLPFKPLTRKACWESRTRPARRICKSSCNQFR